MPKKAAVKIKKGLSPLKTRVINSWGIYNLTTAPIIQAKTINLITIMVAVQVSLASRRQNEDSGVSIVQVSAHAGAEFTMDTVNDSELTPAVANVIVGAGDVSQHPLTATGTD